MSILDRVFGRAETLPAARIEPPVVAAETSGTQAPAAWLHDIGWSGSPSRVKELPPVNARNAARHATVFACCNVIAGDLAKVPLKLYQRGKDGREHRVRDHPAAYLLNVEAAPGITAMTARFALSYAFTLRGRGFAYAPRDGAGELTMIEPVSPDECSVLEAGRRRFYEFEDGEGIFRRVPGRAMVHLRYMAEDGWTSRSPLEVAAESMGLALAGQEAAARAATGTHIKAVAKLASFYEDDESYLRNAKRLGRMLRDPDANGIPVIGAEDDIKSLALSSADIQLLESRKFDREQIAAIYRVPPSKLQMLEFGVKANGQQQAIDYMRDCLLHWGGFVQQQLAMGVLTEGERRSGMFLRHDFNALMQATTKERVEAIVKAVGGPILSPNEGRPLAIDGLGPIEGGDVLYPPPNMTRDDSPDTKEGEDE